MKKNVIYKLYPPFLDVPEEHDFAGAWESFCCKMLNLTHDTSSIIRRKHPDQAVDLYDQEKEFAYQCKSVESGKSSDFRVDKSLDSIRKAKEARRDGTVPWKKYYLCTNVALSGKADTKLRKELPEIKILPESYWQQQCEKHSDYVRRFFRVLREPEKDLKNQKVFIDKIYDPVIDNLRTMKSTVKNFDTERKDLTGEVYFGRDIIYVKSFLNKVTGNRPHNIKQKKLYESAVDWHSNLNEELILCYESFKDYDRFIYLEKKNLIAKVFDFVRTFLDIDGKQKRNVHPITRNLAGMILGIEVSDETLAGDLEDAGIQKTPAEIKQELFCFLIEDGEILTKTLEMIRIKIELLEVTKKLIKRIESIEEIIIGDNAAYFFE
ncbi:MAG: hypothetical protein ACFFD4_40615, partial [Candidatus Odinarchaeota archaeon]